MILNYCVVGLNRRTRPPSCTTPRNRQCMLQFLLELGWVGSQKDRTVVHSYTDQNDHCKNGESKRKFLGLWQHFLAQLFHFHNQFFALWKKRKKYLKMTGQFALFAVHKKSRVILSSKYFPSSTYLPLFGTPYEVVLCYELRIRLIVKFSLENY